MARRPSRSKAPERVILDINTTTGEMRDAHGALVLESQVRDDFSRNIDRLAREQDDRVWKYLEQAAPTIIKTPIRELHTIERDAAIGRKVRGGGRRGADERLKQTRPATEQWKAVASFHAATVRRKDPGVSARQLADEIKKKLAGTRHAKAASTIRTWLNGLTAPTRSAK